jgi:hypothetical protein
MDGASYFERWIAIMPEVQARAAPICGRPSMQLVGCPLWGVEYAERLKFNRFTPNFASAAP